MKLGLLATCLGGAMLWGAALQPRRPTPDMRRAIAFEHQKDLADARQARIEASHPTMNSGERNRDIEEQQTIPGRRVVDPGTSAWQKDHPGQEQ